MKKKMKEIRRTDRITICHMISEEVMNFDKIIFSFRNGDISLWKFEKEFRATSKRIRETIKIVRG